MLDGGFDPSHVDLGGGFGPGKKIRSAYSYHPSLPVDGCLPVYVQHGNNSTGVLGALTDNNQVGVASIGGGFDPAYLGPELALLATWCNGRDDFPAAIVDATAAALPDGQPANCRIISYSAGNYVWHESERLACFTAYQRGSLLCAAKGNHGDELHHYPADYDQHWTLSVGASARLPDWRISKEVFGWGSNYGYSIDLVAPGIDIPTTDLNHGYRDNYSATSAATPLAASAAAALQLNADFTLTPEDIQGLLKAGCSDVLDDLRHPEPTLHGPD
ncbi:MAG: S8 family serine peptidase [Candidatus Eisenbacteria bacterium]|nr:S8 family serine peptidase [Candidatus Eisenbacteria bacterium]